MRAIIYKGRDKSLTACNLGSKIFFHKKSNRFVKKKVRTFKDKFAHKSDKYELFSTLILMISHIPTQAYTENA